MCTYINWLLEVADIPDVGHGVEIKRGVVGVEVLFLVILVVHDEIFLPVGVEDGALVGVSHTAVCSLGNHDWCGFVCDIIAFGCSLDGCLLERKFEVTYMVRESSL